MNLSSCSLIKTVVVKTHERTYTKRNTHEKSSFLSIVICTVHRINIRSLYHIWYRQFSLCENQMLCKVQIPRAILETGKIGFEVPKPSCVRYWVDALKVRRRTFPECRMYFEISRNVDFVCARRRSRRAQPANILWLKKHPDSFRCNLSKHFSDFEIRQPKVGLFSHLT